MAAVEAGKAVFCEKPIDLDLQKVLQARPRFEGARFLLGFNRRFDPHFRALKQKLDAGVVGKLGKCDDGWCRFDVTGRKGWIPQNRLWGAGEP